MSKPVSQESISNNSGYGEPCQHKHHIAFALTAIVAIGLLLSGILGLKEVSFFGSMGRQAAFALTMGGGALLGISFVVYIIYLCTRNPETARPIQQTLKPDPPNDGNVIPRPQAANPAPTHILEQPKPDINPPEEAPKELPDVILEQPSPPNSPQDADPVPEKSLKPPRPENPIHQQRNINYTIVEVPTQNIPDAPMFFEGFGYPSIINLVKDKIPFRTKPINGELEKAQFCEEMEELYCGLLEGKVKIVIEEELYCGLLDDKVKVVVEGKEEEIIFKGLTPLCIIYLARSYVTKHIQEFNKLNPCYAISAEEFFFDFEIEMDFRPAKILEDQMAAFMRSAEKRRFNFFNENPDPWNAKWYAEIDSNFTLEFACFRQKISDQNAALIDLPCGMIDLTKHFALLDALERQLKLPFTMVNVIHFQGTIDKKIEQLSDFANSLTLPDDPTVNPWIRLAMIKIMNFTGVNFIANLRCLQSNEDEDEMRKAQIDSAFEMIIEKLAIEEALAGQWMHLLTMREVIHLSGTAQAKKLSELTNNLTMSDGTLWGRYPEIRVALITTLNAMAVAIIPQQRATKRIEMIVTKLKFEKPLESQLKLLFTMVEVIHFRGLVDMQINNLLIFANNLAMADDPIWVCYPEIRSLMIENLNSMVEGFISNHKFLKFEKRDDARKKAIDAVFGIIAHRLNTDPPKFDIIYEKQTQATIDEDAEEARRLALQFAHEAKMQDAIDEDAAFARRLAAGNFDD